MDLIAYLSQPRSEPGWFSPSALGKTNVCSGTGRIWSFMVGSLRSLTPSRLPVFLVLGQIPWETGLRSPPLRIALVLFIYCTSYSSQGRTPLWLDGSHPDKFRTNSHLSVITGSKDGKALWPHQASESHSSFRMQSILWYRVSRASQTALELKTALLSPLV